MGFVLKVWLVIKLHNEHTGHTRTHAILTIFSRCTCTFYLPTRGRRLSLHITSFKKKTKENLYERYNCFVELKT